MLVDKFVIDEVVCVIEGFESVCVIIVCFGVDCVWVKVFDFEFEGVFDVVLCVDVLCLC